MEKWKRFGISILYIVGYLLCGFIVSAVVSVILVPILMMDQEGSIGETLDALVSISVIPTMIVSSLLVIAGILLTQKLRKKPLKALGFKKFSGLDSILTVVMAIGMMGLIIGFTGIFDSFFSQLMPEYIAENLDFLATGGGPILGLLVIGIIGPFAEELLFRGAIYSEMRKAFSFWPTAIISGLFFGLIHMNLLQGMIGFVLGIVLAYLIYKTGSLWIPIIFHCVYNSSAVVLGYIVPEVQTFNENILFFVIGAIIFVVAFILFVVRKKKKNTEPVV